MNHPRCHAVPITVWLGKLFPGRYPVVVVVTDLAWPHIAGVRFWVGSGATIVSHENSRSFLERVVNSKWSLAPDHLERNRARRHLRFRAVSDSLHLAAGAVRLAAIDGISSESALIAYLPAPRFLWASDYIQDTTSQTLYAREVWRAVQRNGFTPVATAAQHVPLTRWTAIEALFQRH